jgi:hypothetical protein
MHVLEYNKDGELVSRNFDDNKPPQYAILSHRWREEAEEVSFEDIASNAGKDKLGYGKIQFCGEQAKRDGLQYFWIDTCCINKADKAEHSLAIRSMFRWYRHAARCYVYLSDVSAPTPRDGAPWDSEFRASEWFTRGWTLQELLAPSVVEFFSREWRRLGDRVSLKTQIHGVTTIPHEVLEGAPIFQFSVDERFRWRQNRRTKVIEDAAYSLSGIFDVDMAPIYGEGLEQAFGRLHDKIRDQKEDRLKREKCLRDLRVTDPRNDKERIEETKGGLLADSYRWILDNSAFQQWRQDPHSPLLWVKGDPGKGKTMLLCGIIDELHSALSKTALLAYFFCQATDTRINSATAVLRGLLYMIVSQQPSLVSHVREKHDHAGKALFEDANAWIALTEIFVDVLQDPQLSTTYLIVDALDECVTDLPKLLDFIAKQSSTSDSVKWIVSSRNWPNIEEQLEQAGHKVRLSLELNAESVSAAVSVFIQHKVSRLAQLKKYDKQTQAAVFARLTSSAEGTFLWVALVCQDLEKTAKRNALKKLDSFPPGLDALYERMMQQISVSDDAELCKQVLALDALVYRPITLEELVALTKPLGGIADETDLQEIIGLCGSFLTLRGDTVYFVHQSAKDFIFAKASRDVFPSGAEEVHRQIFSRSMTILSGTLHRDMYSVKEPGCPIENVTRPDSDPLAASRYACVYWIDHLYDSKPTFSVNSDCDPQIRDVVDDFLRMKYLYWLEGLSLCRSLGRGVVSIGRLWSLLQVWYPETACQCGIYDLDINASRIPKTKTNLLSLFKTHGDSSCITKGQ